MNFNLRNFLISLKKIGVKKNDNLFIHSNIGFFKHYKNKKELIETCKIIISGLLLAVGKKGTLVFPTFTYSFANNKKYTPKFSKSICGFLSEYVKKMKSSKSYNDPNVSVSVIGEKKLFFTKYPTENAYGKKSFFDRFYKKNGKICNINLDSGSTFIHYFERKLNVNYRHDKAFYGFFSGKKKKRKSIIYVIKHHKKFKPDFTKFHYKAKKYFKICKIGRGTVGQISLKNTFKVITENLKKDQNFLIKKIN